MKYCVKLLWFSKLFCLFLTTVVVSACSSGGTDKATPPTPNLGTVSEYMNADWMFDNYFAPYASYTDEEKADVMLSLKQVANGFVIESQIADINIQQAVNNFHNGMLRDIYDGAGISGAALLDVDGMPEYIDSEFVPESFTSEQMAIMESAGRGMVQDIESELNSYSDITTLDTLPYQLSESVQPYLLIPDNNIELSVRANKASASGGWSHPDLTKWNWWHGDVAITTGSDNFRTFAFALIGHAAMVATYQQAVPIIIEAIGSGVTVNNDINKWGARYKDVVGYHPRVSWNSNAIYTKYSGSYLRGLAVNYALQQKGKPYNFNFFSPGNTSSFYCSSLVWNSYNYAVANSESSTKKVLFKWENIYDFPSLYGMSWIFKKAAEIAGVVHPYGLASDKNMQQFNIDRSNQSF